jgi:hypothetical protein
MVLRHDQQTSIGSVRGKLREYASRALLIAALLGGSLGFLAAPEPVAAAGWNHFIDPGCVSSIWGKATPGINWWGYFPLSTGTAYANLYYWTGSYYSLRSQNPGYQQTGSSGDVRNYVSSQSGSGDYLGEVVYDTTWAGYGVYSEPFACP